MLWKFRKKEAVEKIRATSSELRESGQTPLNELTKQVKRLEIITKKKSSAELSGQYRTRFRGQGVQFSDFRVYQFGDDIRHIDWRASAKTEDTLVKTFEEERELNIFIAVDLSASTLFGSTGTNKRDIITLILSTIVFSAAANNDRIGLLLFTNQVERVVPLRKGRKHALRIIDEILKQRDVMGKPADLSAALKHIGSTCKQNCVVIVASDLFHRVERDKIKKIAFKNDLIFIGVQDRRDSEIPRIGLIQLKDPETDQVVIVDSSSADLQKTLTRQYDEWQAKTRQIIEHAGGSLLRLNTQSDVHRELTRFFSRRKGQK